MTPLPPPPDAARPAADWLAERRPGYAEDAARIVYVDDHYTSEVMARAAAYLTRHAQGESESGFAERCRIADYTPHLAFAADSLAGQLFAEEAQIVRTYDTREPGSGAAADTRLAPPLGDASDRASVLYRLWADLDGAGTGYPTLWRSLAVRLILHHAWYLHVDGVGADGRDATVRLVSPVDVLNETWHAGQLAEVLLAEGPAPRASMTSAAPASGQDGYRVLYTLDGWTRYDAKTGAVVNEGAYAFYADGRRTRRILPVARVAVPLARRVGHALARKANALFNFESGRDWLLWTANHPRLRVASRADAEAARELLATGTNVLIGGQDVGYVAPPTESARIAGEVLEAKTRDFYRTFFRSYADAARQKTATEIAQDVRAGTEAFLVLLAAAMQDAENAALLRLEQVYAPERPAAWGQAFVAYPTSYAPVDEAARADALAARYLDGRAPIGRTATVNVVKRLLAADGIEYDADEVDEAVDEWRDAPGEDGQMTSAKARRIVAAADTVDALAAARARADQNTPADL